MNTEDSLPLDDAQKDPKEIEYEVLVDSEYLLSNVDTKTDTEDILPQYRANVDPKDLGPMNNAKIEPKEIKDEVSVEYEQLQTLMDTQTDTMDILP